MLTNFKLRVEEKLGEEVENSELLVAINMAKDDVVANLLVMGCDIKADYFVDVVARCIETHRKTDLNLISRR
jgi:hypothetical protein